MSAGMGLLLPLHWLGKVSAVCVSAPLPALNTHDDLLRKSRCYGVPAVHDPNVRETWVHMGRNSVCVYRDSHDSYPIRKSLSFVYIDEIDTSSRSCSSTGRRYAHIVHSLGKCWRVSRFHDAAQWDAWLLTRTATRILQVELKDHRFYKF